MGFWNGWQPLADGMCCGVEEPKAASAWPCNVEV